MTLNHFDPSELDRVDPTLDELARELESYAADASPAPPLGLAARIATAIDAEPVPAGRRARLVAWLAPLRGVGRGLAGAAVVAVAVVAAVAFAAFSDATRDRVGSSPNPSVQVVIPSPSEPATPSPSISPTPSTTPTPSASPTISPTTQPTQRPASPTPSDDDDEEDETPEPSDDDSSGSGGDSGSGDNSGPGGGDDD